MSPLRPSRAQRAEPLTSVAQAREALDYWLARLERLPHRRRRARREARTMIARWERRYRDAVIARRGRSPLGRVARGFGLDRLLDPGPAPGNPVARWRRRRALEASRARRRPRGGAWPRARRARERRSGRRRAR